MSDQQQTLTSSLARLQERYRRQSLESRLEAVADDLRDIKLQLAIMEELFGTDVSVDPALIELVNEARRDARNEDYDALEEKIETLEQNADDVRASIEQSLNKQLVSYQNQVDAMERINEKLEVFNQDSLHALQYLLDNWNWREATAIGDIPNFETQLEECRTFGADMRQIYEDAQAAIIEPLVDEGIKDIVGSILESGPVYLADLSPDERESLVDSDLGDYLAISLA